MIAVILKVYYQERGRFMRISDNFVKIIKNILIDLDEIKQAQFVGRSQIKAKYYERANAYDLQFAVTAQYQSQGSSHKTIKITVTPQNIPSGNILLADIIPDIRDLNGGRVSSWDFSTNSINYTTNYSVMQTNAINPAQNEYLLHVIAPTNTILRLKLGVISNCDVTFNIQELN